MPYEPVEDIPNIEKLKVDLRKLSLLMREVITTTRIAIRQPYNFNKRFDYERELRTFLGNQLVVYGTTHDSIFILLRFMLRKKYYPAVVDAASLAREQIEKIFSITLVLSNPHKWIKQGLRGNWRTDYEVYLLALEEHGLNPRYEKYLTKHYVEFLKNGQRSPSSYKRQEIIVSEFAKRALTHYWKNPGGKNPVWFSTKFPRGKALRNYLSEYFEFPTPGKSVRYITGSQLRRFLYRWHKEYSYFSQYTHIGIWKEIIPVMSENRNLKFIEKTEINTQNLMEQVIFTSYTALASSCTLILEHLRDGHGAWNYLKEFWKELEGSSLLSRAFWNICPKIFFIELSTSEYLDGVL